MDLLFLNIIIGLFIAYSFVSLLEYGVHRFLMHSPRLAKLFGNEHLDHVYADHEMHHNKWYAIYNFESDPIGRLYNLGMRVSTGLILVALPFAGLWFVNHVWAVELVLVMIVHNLTWNYVHPAIHLDVDNAFTRTPLFRFWKKYHFLHHRQQGRNFSALCPGPDKIFKTAAVERESDRLEMQKRLWTVRRPKKTHQLQNESAPQAQQ